MFCSQTPFGYTRKDVLLIGVGVTLLGYGLKYGLEVTSVLSLFSITTPVRCFLALTSSSSTLHWRTCMPSLSHPCHNWTQLVGVDPLQAGNAVQLIIVLGMTVGWISTYMFRVANKDMTYAQQLRDYEKQVMEVWHLFILVCSVCYYQEYEWLTWSFLLFVPETIGELDRGWTASSARASRGREAAADSSEGSGCYLN